MNRTEQFGRYLQREDTGLAKALKRISPTEGEAYRNSWQKRTLDLGVSIPATFALTLPITPIAMTISAIEHGANPIFVEWRRRGGRKRRYFPVPKVRTMRPGAHLVKNEKAVEKLGDKGDVRVSNLDGKIRGAGIDEFLQFPLIAIGLMSAVGPRAAPEKAFARQAEHRPDDIEQINKDYAGGPKGRPGLVSAYSVFSGHRKDEKAKYHYDRLYAKRASLGFDLLILYKHLEGPLSSIENRLRRSARKLSPAVLPFRRRKPDQSDADIAEAA